MLIDEIELTIKAGHGGEGRVSFFPYPQKGPDGGNGGKGGDVYIKTTSDLSALNRFTKNKVIEAEDGQMGGKNKMFGKNGKDLVITIPDGCLLVNLETGEELEIPSSDELFLICKGGLGGRGNAEFKSPSNTTPRFAQPGLRGQEKRFKVILKLIADFGLIGLPNAGKSSLLNELTKANVKVANYPFTTLEPNLGMLYGKIIADIPGLIEGASSGKGLGINFLKHIEKTSVLLHTISAESDDVLKDYKTIRTELEQYSKDMLNKETLSLRDKETLSLRDKETLSLRDKEEIILLTKTDLVEKQTVKAKTAQLKKLKRKIIPVSIHDWDSLEAFKKVLV